MKTYSWNVNGIRAVIRKGDLNVAHTPDDLARPRENEGRKGYTVEECDGFQRHLDARKPVLVEKLMTATDKQRGPDRRCTESDSRLSISMIPRCTGCLNSFLDKLTKKNL